MYAYLFLPSKWEGEAGVCDGREFFFDRDGFPELDKDWEEPGTEGAGGKAGVDGGASCCCCNIDKQCPKHCNVALVVALRTSRSASELCIPGPMEKKLYKNIKFLIMMESTSAILEILQNIWG